MDTATTMPNMLLIEKSAICVEGKKGARLNMA